MTQQDALKRLVKWRHEEYSAAALWAANFYADTRARMTAALVDDWDDSDKQAPLQVNIATKLTHALIADMTGGSDE